MITRRDFNIKHSVAGVWYNNGAGQRYLSHELTGKTTVTYTIINADGSTTSALAIFAGHITERQIIAILAARDKNETTNLI